MLLHGAQLPSATRARWQAALRRSGLVAVGEPDDALGLAQAGQGMGASQEIVDQRTAGPSSTARRRHQLGVRCRKATFCSG